MPTTSTRVSSRSRSTCQWLFNTFDSRHSVRQYMPNWRVSARLPQMAKGGIAISSVSNATRSCSSWTRYSVRYTISTNSQASKATKPQLDFAMRPMMNLVFWDPKESNLKAISSTSSGPLPDRPTKINKSWWLYSTASRAKSPISNKTDWIRFEITTSKRRSLISKR